MSRTHSLRCADLARAVMSRLIAALEGDSRPSVEEVELHAQLHLTNGGFSPMSAICIIAQMTMGAQHLQAGILRAGCQKYSKEL